MRGHALLVDVGRDIVAVVQDIACMASDDNRCAGIVGVHALPLASIIASAIKYADTEQFLAFNVEPSAKAPVKIPDNAFAAK